jgi:DNA-binding GntR family transcriptional regulator
MSSAIKKIKVPQNLTQLAYNSIKAYILREDIDEKTRLTEDTLSSQLGISKSPVREALNSLQTEGLIRIEPRRGAFLRGFSLSEVKDLYDLREVMEVYAVGAAAITPELIEGLRQSIRRSRTLQKANDRFGHIEEDVNFHGLIAAATGNVELCHLLSNLQNQIWLCRRLSCNLSSSTASSAHSAILEALEEGDREGAQGAMKNHITTIRKRLIAQLENGKSSS